MERAGSGPWRRCITAPRTKEKHATNQVIPTAAILAAKEALREVTPPPGISKADWLAEHGDFALIAGAIAAATPHMMGDTVGTNPSETIRQLVREWVDTQTKGNKSE